MDSVTRTVHGSSLADVAWIDDDGGIRACGAVVLLWGETPAIAFSYAYADLARSIAAAPQAAFAFTETRSTSSTFVPGAITGRPALVEDYDGSTFTEELLEQELRRHPPARVFADSVLLRREHWWYLPRLIVTLDVEALRSLPPRTGQGPTSSDAKRPLAVEYLLAVSVDGRLQTHLVRAAESGSSRALLLEPVAGGALPRGRAVLAGQDASFPDRQQWSTWQYRGFCTGSSPDSTETGAVLEVAEAPEPGSSGLEPVPTVWQRMRREQKYGKACRQGVAEAERRLA
ncbi:pyridoxamine 5'-phosphate oxidase family protein [Arthrobacter castelli]|uniref:pyridoxamine 5'-phosphate oxidase family protein n=1 Tax=Arthrobacter castelli TaxID=271431 RepID=UPI000423AD74|nr:pyridoxamine 5'-phosphate oxidase family protein [Arthrobacter castelli]